MELSSEERSRLEENIKESNSGILIFETSTEILLSFIGNPINGSSIIEIFVSTINMLEKYYEGITEIITEFLKTEFSPDITKEISINNKEKESE